MCSAVSIGHDDPTQVIKCLFPTSGLLFLLGQVFHYNNVILVGTHLETGSGTGGTVQGIDGIGYGRVGYVVRCQCNRIKGKLHLTASAGVVGTGIDDKIHLLQIISDVIGNYTHSLRIGTLDHYSLRIVTHTQHTHKAGQ